MVARRYHIHNGCAHACFSVHVCEVRRERVFLPGANTRQNLFWYFFFFYLLRFFSLFFLLLPFLLLFPFLLRTTTNLITRDGGVQQNTVQRLQRRRKNRVHISPVIGYYYLPTSAYLRPPVNVHDIITSRRPWLGDGQQGGRVRLCSQRYIYTHVIARCRVSEGLCLAFTGSLKIFSRRNPIRGPPNIIHVSPRL